MASGGLRLARVEGLIEVWIPAILDVTSPVNTTSATPEQVQRLSKFAMNIGLAFQVPFDL